MQLWITGFKSQSTLNSERVSTSICMSGADEGISSNSAMKNKQELIYSALLLWKSWMYCCAIPSYRELTAEIKPGCGVWALWCCARGWTMCAVQTSQRGGGVARARSWTPRRTGSSSSGILMMAGQESLRQRKLSQATSCDRLARISFMAWTGPQIWKPQHYEAAHGKAFLAILALPSSYPGWNEIENTLCAVRDLKLREQAKPRMAAACPDPISRAIRLL